MSLRAARALPVGEPADLLHGRRLRHRQLHAGGRPLPRRGARHLGAGLPALLHADGATMDIAGSAATFACLLLATRWSGLRRLVGRRLHLAAAAHFRTWYWMAFDAGGRRWGWQTVSARFYGGRSPRRSSPSSSATRSSARRCSSASSARRAWESSTTRTIRSACGTSQIAKLARRRCPPPSARRRAARSSSPRRPTHALVSERLRALGWCCWPTLRSRSRRPPRSSGRPTTSDRRAARCCRLPCAEVARFRLAAKPWEALLSARSLRR